MITPKGKHEPEDAIRPVSTAEIPDQYRNLMGMTAEGTSLVAVFPLDALSEENEVHIIYDSGVHDGGEHKYCEDCYTQFKLDKVRSTERKGSVGANTNRRQEELPHPTTLPQAAAADSESGAGIPPGMYWVVDERTQTYLPVGCTEVSKIPPAQRLYYTTEASVQAAGYKRSENC